MGHDPQIKDFVIFVFQVFQVKNCAQKAKIPLFFPTIEMYCVCRWIGNKILPLVDLFKFEISLLEAKIFFFFIESLKLNFNRIMEQFCVKIYFQNNFCPEEVPESEKMTLLNPVRDSSRSQSYSKPTKVMIMKVATSHIESERSSI